MIFTVKFTAQGPNPNQCNYMETPPVTYIWNRHSPDRQTWGITPSNFHLIKLNCPEITIKMINALIFCLTFREVVWSCPGTLMMPGTETCIWKSGSEPLKQSFSTLVMELFRYGDISQQMDANTNFYESHDSSGTVISVTWWPWFSQQMDTNTKFLWKSYIFSFSNRMNLSVLF